VSLNSERDVKCKTLRVCNFLPFSLEYLIGNLNKKIEAIIIEFPKIVVKKLEVNL